MQQMQTPPMPWSSASVAVIAAVIAAIDVRVVSLGLRDRRPASGEFTKVLAVGLLRPMGAVVRMHFVFASLLGIPVDVVAHGFLLYGRAQIVNEFAKESTSLVVVGFQLCQRVLGSSDEAGSRASALMAG